MSRWVKIAIGVFVVVGVLGIAMLLSMLRRGFSALDEPSAMEAMMATTIAIVTVIMTVVVAVVVAIVVAIVVVTAIVFVATAVMAGIVVMTIPVTMPRLCGKRDDCTGHHQNNECTTNCDSHVDELQPTDPWVTLLVQV